MEDQLPKEAAAEAKEMGEETSMITVHDIRRYVRVTVMLKWQERWHIGQTGHDFNICKTSVVSNTRLDFSDKTTFKQIFQLRKSYCILNEYRHKLGQMNRPEPVEQFLCECPEYDGARILLIMNLRNEIGLQTLNLYFLIGYEDNIRDCKLGIAWTVYHQQWKIPSIKGHTKLT